MLKSGRTAIDADAIWGLTNFYKIFVEPYQTVGLSQWQYEAIERLRQIASSAEAFTIWDELGDRLGDLKVIISSKHGSLAVPSVTSLGGQGFLFSPFTNGKLFFLDQGIHRAMYMAGSSGVEVCVELLYDSNAAGFVSRLVENCVTPQLQPQVNALRRFFQQNSVSSVNWNYFLYMAENAEAWMQMQNLDEIFRTILAGERLTDMDAGHFRDTGEFRTEVPLEQHMLIAQQKLASSDRYFKEGGGRLHKAYRDLFYIAGLAMAEIQLEHPSPRQARRKMKRFLEFMDQELNVFTHLLIHAAWLLFSNPPGKIRFFGGLQGTKNPLALVRNFSWDLQHWFWVQTALTLPIRDRVFQIPVLMTFDKRFAEIVPAFQARSFVLCGPRNPQPIYPLDARDFVALFTKDPDVQEALFDPARVLARAERRTAANAELESLITNYETRLLERLRKGPASKHA